MIPVVIKVCTNFAKILQKILYKQNIIPGDVDSGDDGMAHHRRYPPSSDNNPSYQQQSYYHKRRQMQSRQYETPL